MHRGKINLNQVSDIVVVNTLCFKRAVKINNLYRKETHSEVI